MSQHRECGVTSGNSARRLCWISGAGLLVSLSLSHPGYAEENRLLKLPSIFRKSEQPAVQPQAKKEVREAADDRVLARARQLMADARKEELQGRLESALDLAARADGVYRAAQRTTDARWPANETAPNEYVRHLESKLLQRASQQQAANSPAASVSVGVLPGNSNATGRSNVGANVAANANTLMSDFGKAQRPADDAAVANAEALAAGLLPSPAKALEGLTKRGGQALETATAIKGIADAVLETPAEHGEATGASAPAEPSKVDKSLQTARTVLDRLDQMQHWQTVSGEKPANEKSTDHVDPPLPNGDESAARGNNALRTPVLIGTPSGIEDDQVNPIPTQFHGDVANPDGPAPIEIRQPSDPSAMPGKLMHDLPGMPMGAKSHDSSSRPDPWLMPPVTGESKEATEPVAKASVTPLWLIGTVQAIATFVGALGALLVVIALRPKAKAAVATTAVPQAAAVETASSEVAEPVVEHANAAHEPTTIPFRRIEPTVEKDNAKFAAATTQDAAAKSVFEQNLQLLDELNHLAEKKAA